MLLMNVFWQRCLQIKKPGVSPNHGLGFGAIPADGREGQERG